MTQYYFAVHGLDFYLPIYDSLHLKRYHAKRYRLAPVPIVVANINKPLQ